MLVVIFTGYALVLGVVFWFAAVACQEAARLWDALAERSGTSADIYRDLGQVWEILGAQEVELNDLRREVRASNESLALHREHD